MWKLPVSVKYKKEAHKRKVAPFLLPHGVQSVIINAAHIQYSVYTFQV